MIREIISTNGPQTAIDDSLLKILGIVVAITWPVFTVLPHHRFGGVLMLNGLLYGLLLLLSIILLPRPNLSKLIITTLIFFLLFYLTPVIQSLQLNSISAEKTSFDIVITHLTFLLAGISAGRNFPLFAKYFFRTLLLIVVANLAIELYLDFSIRHQNIGFFGSQGFARIVSLTALGLIITEKPPSFTGPKFAAMLIYCIAIFLCIFAGARSSLIGITAALLVLYLDSKEKIIKFILFSLIGAALLSLLVSAFYLETLRPILFHGDPHSGFNRTLLSLDIFYIGEVETKRTLFSIMDRLHLWRDSIRIAFEHPFGTGFGGYEKYTVSGIEISPHNVPLELIVEMGFLIATVFLTLMALIIVASPRSILPYMVYLTIFFLFSGNFVDARQLLFFAAVALQFHRGATQNKDMASPPGSTQQV